MSSYLVVLLELPVAKKTIMHSHLVHRAKSDQARVVDVVGIKFSLFQFH